MIPLKAPHPIHLSFKPPCIRCTTRFSFGTLSGCVDLLCLVFPEFQEMHDFFFSLQLVGCMVTTAWLNNHHLCSSIVTTIICLQVQQRQPGYTQMQARLVLIEFTLNIWKLVWYSVLYMHRVNKKYTHIFCTMKGNSVVSLASSRLRLIHK